MDGRSDDGEDAAKRTRPPPTIYDPLQQGPAWFITHPSTKEALPTSQPVQTVLSLNSRSEDREREDAAKRTRPPPTIYDPLQQGPAWFITHPSTKEALPTSQPAQMSLSLKSESDDRDDAAKLHRPPPTIYDPLQQGPAWFITHPSTLTPLPASDADTTTSIDVAPEISTQSSSDETRGLVYIKPEPSDPLYEVPVERSDLYLPDNYPDTQLEDPLKQDRKYLKLEPSSCKMEMSSENDVANPGNIPVAELSTSEIQVPVPLILSSADLDMPCSPTSECGSARSIVNSPTSSQDYPNYPNIPEMFPSFPKVSITTNSNSTSSNDFIPSMDKLKRFENVPAPPTIEKCSIASSISKYSATINQCYVRLERLPFVSRAKPRTTETSLSTLLPSGNVTTTQRTRYTSKLSTAENSKPRSTRSQVPYRKITRNDTERKKSKRVAVKESCSFIKIDIDQHSSNHNGTISKDNTVNDVVTDVTSFTQATSQCLPSDECNQEVKTTGELGKHLKRHHASRESGKGITTGEPGKHPKRQHVSRESGKGITTDSAVETRVDAVNNERSKTKKKYKLAKNKQNGFACESCSRVFKCPKSFKKHILSIHTGPKPITIKQYDCNLCWRHYEKKSSFKAHICVKNKFIGFKCKFCKKVFPKLSFLKPHLETHNNPSKVFLCDLCPKKFDTRVAIESHVRIHITIANRFKCDKCSKVFTKEGNFNNHILSGHGNPKIFTCDYCSKGFKQRNNLADHIMRRHTMSSVKPFPCVNCHMKFKSNFELRNHSSVHSNEKPYKCNKCEKSFKKKIGLRYHNQSLHNDTPPIRSFCCPTCGKLLKSKAFLKNHMNLHSITEKLFECDRCSKKFKTKPYLNDHIKTVHLNPKSHKCAECGKAFSELRDLKKHILTHTSEKPFVCDVCSKGFKSKTSLDYHLTIAYHCATCGRDLKSRTFLKDHLLAHESKKLYPCNLCSKGFNVKTDLDTHIAKCSLKPYKCKPCDVGFISIKALKLHQLKHKGSKILLGSSLTCDDCGRRFHYKAALRHHIIFVHSGVRPFMCKTCEKSFKTERCLGRHLKIHDKK